MAAPFLRWQKDNKKNVVRLFVGRRIGLIFGWALTPKDYWHEKKLGDKPLVWLDSVKGEKVNVLCLYAARAYVALFKRRKKVIDQLANAPNHHRMPPLVRARGGAWGGMSKRIQAKFKGWNM